MKYLQKSIEYVDGLFGKTEPHFGKTVEWLLKLKPDASEAMQISAYCHDVERALRRKNKELIRKALTQDPEMTRQHQETGARAMKDFLIKEGGGEEMANEVYDLILKHEDGGTPDQNLLKDADSLSYLETNAIKHAGWTDFSKEEIRGKYDYMYNRITDKKAKVLAMSLYEAAIKLLESK